MKIRKIQKLALIQLSAASAVLGVPIKPKEGIEKLIEHHPKEPKKEHEVEFPTEVFVSGNYCVKNPQNVKKYFYINHIDKK